MDRRSAISLAAGVVALILVGFLVFAFTLGGVSGAGTRDKLRPHTRQDARTLTVHQGLAVQLSTSTDPAGSSSTDDPTESDDPSGDTSDPEDSTDDTTQTDTTETDEASDDTTDDSSETEDSTETSTDEATDGSTETSGTLGDD